MSQPEKPPFPKVGDFVLIGHGIWREPENWWISQVEWADGETFLCRENYGLHPTQQPYLNDAQSLIGFGAKELLLKVRAAGIAAKKRHEEAYRAANIALNKVRDQIIEDVIAAAMGSGSLPAKGVVG